MIGEVANQVVIQKPAPVVAIKSAQGKRKMCFDVLNLFEDAC